MGRQEEWLRGTVAVGAALRDRPRIGITKAPQSSDRTRGCAQRIDILSSLIILLEIPTVHLLVTHRGLSKTLFGVCLVSIMREH